MSAIVTFIVLEDCPVIKRDLVACEIIEQHYTQGKKIQVVCSNGHQREQLSHALWSFKQDAFLPNDTSDDNFLNHATILLSLPDQNNINSDLIINLNEQAIINAHQHKHIIEFVCCDEHDIQQRRKNYKEYQKNNLKVENNRVSYSDKINN